jgi:hypothetical protein
VAVVEVVVDNILLAFPIIIPLATPTLLLHTVLMDPEKAVVMVQEAVVVVADNLAVLVVH